MCGATDYGNKDRSDDTARSKANAFCKFFINVASNLKISTCHMIDFVWKGSFVPT